jgi:SAM-dependent MidA family methyltransferase
LGAIDLKGKLLQRIRSSGPITFADFMEVALYDPEGGFYTRPPVGEAAGHFVTSPHVSRAFGALLARQVGQAWDLLGKPSQITVLEVGAGDGTLGRQILEGVRVVPELEGALRYVAVERSAGARPLLAEAGLEVRPSLDEVEPFTGCVLANELLDNLPFRRVRQREGRTLEVLVGAEDGRLIEVEEEAPTDLVDLISGPSPSEERPVSPEALGFVRDVARVLERGYCFLFDYGFREGETPGPVHAYRDHRVLEDVLEEPGSRDVTAAVDLAAVAREATAAGLQVWGPLSQREALLGLGFRTWMQALRSRQTELQVTRGWRDAARVYSERQRASILIDPTKLGGLQVLVLGTEGLPPPAAAIGDRETGC